MIGRIKLFCFQGSVKFETRFLYLVIFLLVATAAPAQHLREPKNWVDELAQKAIRQGAIKAISIGIIDSGKTYIYHYGDLGNGQQPNDSSCYEIASITKTFTGFLLAKAIEEKRINLDDDIRKYLDESYPNLEYQSVPVSFRNLITHMAGLPYTFPDKPEIFVNPDYDKLPFILDSLEKGYTRNNFFEDLHKVNIQLLPGTQIKYSNVDANLLAYILEKVYLTSYENLLTDFILKYASMSHTTLLAASKPSNLVKGYNTKGVEMPFLSLSTKAAGGIISTMPDMMKYISLNLNETNSIVKLSHDQLWKADKGNYALGYYWQMDKTKKERKIFQNGGSFGTSSWLEFYPDSQLGIFIVSNVSGPEIHGILSSIADKIYKELKRN